MSTGKWQVSSDGGINPVWAHNGRELFFLDLATTELKAVEFTTTSTTFQTVRRTTLFAVPPTVFYGSGGSNNFYDVALDDERFLMVRQSGPEGLVVVLNFFEELRQRVPN